MNGEMTELAEGARLEIVCAVNSGTEGSNPSLSAIIGSEWIPPRGEACLVAAAIPCDIPPGKP
jgi:hypothetical protein